MILFFNRVTQSKELQDELESVYALFIANVFLDSTRAMLKGVLRALGTQNHVVIYHILWQAMALPAILYGLAFNVFEENPIQGIWLSMTAVNSLLVLGYFERVTRTDWTKIAIKVFKRTKKIAGEVEDEQQLLENGGQSEK